MKDNGTKTGGYTAEYLAAGLNFGDSDVFMQMFEEVPEDKWNKAMAQ